MELSEADFRFEISDRQPGCQDFEAILVRLRAEISKLFGNDAWTIYDGGKANIRMTDGHVLTYKLSGLEDKNFKFKR